MPFQYKKILVVGATSGIGEALAAKFVEEGSNVIVTGRRKQNLDAFVNNYPDKATAMEFDITQLEQIPGFVSNVTKSHPDLDCVLLNSGIQRGFDFSKPESIDLSVLDMEFRTNYLSYMHIMTAILPFLLAKKTESALILMSSGLAMVPLPRCLNYCATKAALHQFAISLRHQLKATPVKVIEVFPPAVQTELHDAKHQPDIKDGGSIGMPLKDFTEEAYQGLVKGDGEVPVGLANHWYNAIEPARQEQFRGLLKFYGADD